MKKSKERGYIFQKYVISDTIRGYEKLENNEPVEIFLDIVIIDMLVVG
ncbi:hypothetical protein [Priestia megaterium]|nr:hypothetical protein [Priestia megaterium]UYP07147.1 hypothetical protein OIJ04_23855 [Priestia megaterium]